MGAHVAAPPVEPPRVGRDRPAAPPRPGTPVPGPGRPRPGGRGAPSARPRRVTVDLVRRPHAARPGRGRAGRAIAVLHCRHRPPDAGGVAVIRPQREGPLTRELVRQPGGFGLGQVPSRLKPDETVSMVCGFCSTGCSLDVHLRNGVPVNLTPTRGYPVNLGMACPKGWESLRPLAADDRATTPLWRDARGRLQPVSWPTAINVFVEKMRSVLDTHGPESAAFLSTGQIPTEEMALLGALTKFGMGMLHGDGNTRQCMATSVVAYKQAFGFDAPPYSYADFESSDVIVLWGSNLCIAHPIMWERVCMNPHRPEIIVVDPRTTETAVAATQHYGLQPKSDLVLLYGLARLLIERGAVDRGFVEGHTSGFDEFVAHVGAYDLDMVSDATGLTHEQLERFASTIATGQRVSFWWTMGVNQSHQAVRTAQAIINLALMTGNIGRPGTGANSITGQCNAMGSRLFSNTTNLMGGHDFADPIHRAKVADVLDIDEERIPPRPSDAYDQILDHILEGRIKALWIIATNSAHSWINQHHVREALSRLELLVVQDMYATTETAQLAHLVLPAAGWGEKEGTFINSERRIGTVKRVAKAPGHALSDFAIFRLIAEAWGCGEMFKRWSTPEDVFTILQELSSGQPCDISGIDGYRALDAQGGIQWPVPAGTAVIDTERRLFEDGRFFHPDGRARFVFDQPRPPLERPGGQYPLVLLTGRASSAQWHTGTRTGKSALLRSLSPTKPYVEISPGDATKRDIEPNDRVVVRSARGSMRARAFVTANVAEGQVFIPMHFEETNRLSDSSFDPHSRQPSYKYCAVEVSKPEPADR
ncbi:MAG: nitrate reductase [Acidobacteria bacterium]|nr:nitrate reductase [Acidobacteriota bacterium]